MKEPMQIRVFKLAKDKYRLIGSLTTFEEYVVSQIEAGYIITGLKNFGIKKLQVTSHYAPTQAKKVSEVGSMVSELADTPTEEV